MFSCSMRMLLLTTNTLICKSQTSQVRLQYVDPSFCNRQAVLSCKSSEGALSAVYARPNDSTWAARILLRVVQWTKATVQKPCNPSRMSGGFLATFVIPKCLFLASHLLGLRLAVDAGNMRTDSAEGKVGLLMDSRHKAALHPSLKPSELKECHNHI